MTDKENFETLPGFESEKDAEEAFDYAVMKSDCFRNYAQVAGRYIHVPHYKTPADKAVIDRILLPNQRLIDAGFKGAIGVEVKNSGMKVSALYSQMMDYMRCAWRVESLAVVLDYVFLFPSDKLSHGMASISDQNHLGTCCVRYPEDNEFHRLEFFTGEHCVIEIHLNKDNEIKVGKTTGLKQGSR